MNKIIGLYGMMCSGKDTVASFFEERGYVKISMSEDLLKPILKRLRLKTSRLNYIKLSRGLKSFKPEALAFLSHSLMNKGSNQKYIIPNIMHFKEALFFKKQEDINFFLFKVSADLKKRYERNLKRKSEKDVISFAKFQQQDKLNLNNTGLKELMHARLADDEIINKSTIPELKKRVNELIKEFKL